MTRLRASVVAIAFMLLPGCTDTGVEATTVPLFLRGRQLDEPLVVDDFTVELSEARLAFGPLYLCTGTQAGDLCETALLEWLDATQVDLLDPTPRWVGPLRGSTGFARSWMYDLGITSIYTAAEPLVLPAAEGLQNSSLLVVGTATSNETSYAFRAAIPVQQSVETETGIPVVRKSQDEPFDQEVRNEGEQRLDIAFDVVPWIRDVDFAAMVPADGATGPVEVEPDTQPYRALRNALLAGRRPDFEWR